MLEALRKFGLSYCDFPTLVDNITFFLRTLSLNVDPRNKKRIPTFFTVLGIVFVASYCYVYLVSMIWFVFWRCMETGDVLSALIVFSLGIASSIGLYKIIFMFYQRIKLTQLIGQCLESYALAEPGSRFTSNLNMGLRAAKRRAIVFWCVVMGDGILYIMKPLILPGRHLMEDFYVLLGLEPMFETPNYEIAFILTAMGVFATVYFTSNATACQIVISGYIEAQMLALSEELINLWKDANLYYSESNIQAIDTNINNLSNEIVVNEHVNLHLKNIIKAHATNLHLWRQTEDVFKGAVAVEFSILMIGLIAGLLAGLENTYMEVPFSLIQVGMDCFTGQRLTDASMVFERAVYHCKWEHFNNRNMKLVLMMMIMSQKTMTLSAGGITKLNFVTLLVVIKMIYSAYTTLSATVK